MASQSCLQNLISMTKPHASLALLALFLVTAVAPVSAIAAKGPLDEKNIPLFPAATPFAEKEDLTSLDWSRRDDPSIRSMSIKGYTTSATPEEVAAWYRKQLAPRMNSRDIADDPRPGETSAVSEEIRFHDFSQYGDRDGGKARRAKMAKDRKPYRTGNWILTAGYSWQKLERNGDHTLFNVDIHDRSYHWDGSFRRKTVIMVQRVTEKSAATLVEESEDKMDREQAARGRQLAGNSLDPKALGVPLYPGARHDAHTTQMVRNSMGADGIAYRTSDKLAAVAAFYLKQPGIRSIGEVARESAMFGAACKEEYIAVLKKKVMLGCDINLTVQNPWMDMNSGKMISDTLITIVRQTE